jgi:hypothetical protein
MPDTAETSSGQTLHPDQDSAGQVTRAAAAARPGQAGQRDAPAVISAGSRPTVPAGPVTVTRPGHRVHALATFELSRYRRDLEHAITGVSPDAPAQDDLRRQLDDVLAEEESRTHIQHASRKGAPGL